LLALQIVHITPAFRIGHPLVTTLCILSQLIVVLAALTVCHLSVSALFVAAEPIQF
jgi:hypothetical protein